MAGDQVIKLVNFTGFTVCAFCLMGDSMICAIYALSLLPYVIIQYSLKAIGLCGFYPLGVWKLYWEFFQNVF